MRGHKKGERNYWRFCGAKQAVNRALRSCLFNTGGQARVVSHAYTQLFRKSHLRHLMIVFHKLPRNDDATRRSHVKCCILLNGGQFCIDNIVEKYIIFFFCSCFWCGRLGRGRVPNSIYLMRVRRMYKPIKSCDLFVQMRSHQSCVVGGLKRIMRARACEAFGAMDVVRRAQTICIHGQFAVTWIAQ